MVRNIVEGVYSAIPATSTAPEIPPIRIFSRQLVAYIAVFLPVAPYFRASDGRVSGVCDEQYSATFERLQETSDEAFKLYMTRKTQGWFRRWGRPRTFDAAASPTPGAGAGAWTPAKDTAPVPSDDEDGGLISPNADMDGGGQASSAAL